MAYITNIKYDDVAQRFLKNIMKTVSDSLAEPKQSNITTPTVDTDVCSTSNSSADTAQNPFHGILNAAFNFNGSPDTANSLIPVADMIMETINMLAPKLTTTPKKEACIKKAEQTKPTMQTSNCSATLTQNNTVCTGIESSAQCNATASTPILRPFCSLFTQGFSPERKREVGLEFSVGGTTTVSKCPYAAGSKLFELSNKISVLREHINELPGGDKYLKTIDNAQDAILYQLMMQNYEKMLVFRENHVLSGSIASIVQKQQPKVILPDTAKKVLTAYVNATQIAKPIIDIYDTISLTKPEYTKLETVVSTWLSENTDMYVVV